MARLLISLFLVFTAAPMMAQSAHIEDIGIHGHYRPNTPTSIRVQLSNPTAQAIPFELKISIDAGRIGSSPDLFSLNVPLPANSQRNLDLPIPIRYGGQGPTLDFIASTPAGIIAHDHRHLSDDSSNLVLILCFDDQLCRQAEELLATSGTTDELAGKKSDYLFLPSRDPLPDWWAYSSASHVLLAVSPSALTAEQRLALEGYLRQGGKLLLPESIIGKSDFLAPYRKGFPTGKPQPVGLGSLYRFTGIDAQLAAAFNTDPSQRDVATPYWVIQSRFADAMNYCRLRLALNFVFPGFAWLLCWLAAYILVVGLLNFQLLSHYDRRELGWITVPVISILFSIAFYWSGSAHRPRQLQLDEIALYQLDDASPLAFSNIGLRVSSPSLADLVLTAPQNILWDNPNWMPRDTFTEGLPIRNFDASPGWNIQLGPQQQFPLQLLPWSFQDLDFKGFHQFPGTVVRSNETQLLNQTGLSFQDAIFLDEKNLYSLGSVPAGAAVDLSAHNSESPESMEFVRRVNNMTFVQYESKRLAGTPFSIKELLDYNLASFTKHPDSAIFIGISDGPVPDANLPGHFAIHKSYAITIVSIGATP
jgi:hypothetical protein